MDNIPTRQQNPGDLKDPTTGKIRTFASPQEGHAALLNDLTAKMTGTSTTGIGPSSTLADFAKVYAPASDNNNPAQYTANLANKLGVSPDTKIGTLTGRIGDFANAISGNEGYNPKPFSNPSGGVANQFSVDTTGAPPPPPAQQKTSDNPIINGLQSFGRSLASPLLGVAATPVQGIAKLMGQSDPYANGINIPGLGNTSVSPLDLEKKTGDVAQTAGLLVPGEGVLGAVGSGALLGGGNAMSQGKGFFDTAIQTAEGGALGGALAGSAKLLGGGLQKVGGLLSGETAQKMTQGIKDAYTKALNLNAGERGLERVSGKDLANTLMKYQAPLGRNEANNTLDASGAIEKLQSVLTPLNAKADRLLNRPQGVVKYVNLPTILKTIKSNIQDMEGVTQDDRNAAIAEAEKLLTAEIGRYGTDVEPAVADKIKQGFWGSTFTKASDYPGAVRKETSFIAGKALQKNIEDVMAGTDEGAIIKTINAQRSELTDAIKRLTKLDASRFVRGGRLGHMAGGVQGAIIGLASGFGAPGALAGDYFGTQAAKYLTDPATQIAIARGKQAIAGSVPGLLGKTTPKIGIGLSKAGGLIKKGARAAGLIGNIATK